MDEVDIHPAPATLIVDEYAQAKPAAVARKAGMCNSCGRVIKLGEYYVEARTWDLSQRVFFHNKDECL